MSLLFTDVCACVHAGSFTEFLCSCKIMYPYVWVSIAACVSMCVFSAAGDSWQKAKRRRCLLFHQVAIDTMHSGAAIISVITTQLSYSHPPRCLRLADFHQYKRMLPLRFQRCRVALRYHAWYDELLKTSDFLNRTHASEFSFFFFLFLSNKKTDRSSLALYVEAATFPTVPCAGTIISNPIWLETEVDRVRREVKKWRGVLVLRVLWWVFWRTALLSKMR